MRPGGEEASATPPLDEQLLDELAALESRALRRRLPGLLPEGGASGPVDLVGNDYLGLAREPRLVAAAREALEAEGAGGRAARLLGGGGAAASALETRAASWLGAERSLPSGTHANQAAIGALAGRGDVVLSDELNHASLIDAMRLARAEVRVFPHSDLAAVERQLLGARGFRRRFVVVESIYSMEGDAAPLAELAELCERHDAWMIVDEAHAAGLVGPRGASLWAAAVEAGAPRVRSHRDEQALRLVERSSRVRGRGGGGREPGTRVHLHDRAGAGPRPRSPRG